MFDSEPIGSGTYFQQRADDNLLFRLDLKIQIGDQPSTLVHVRDGQGRLWTYEKLPGSEAELSRIDIQRVEERLRETGGMEDLEIIGGVARWPSLGGLPKLLRALHKTFQFVSVEETQWTSHQSMPVWKLSGQWNPQRLAKMLPEAGQGVVVDQYVKLAKLPPQLPDQVVLYLGKQDLFPYRLEYRRDTAPEATQEHQFSPWWMILEIFEVRFNPPVAARQFQFPPSLDYIDKTDEFIKSLK